MGIKAALSKPFAAFVVRKINKWRKSAVESQEKVFKQLISSAKHTAFGNDHEFDGIRSYADFKEKVPIRDYEGLKPYIEQVLSGKIDVLWPGKPLYMAKTSGTTSGVKYIPLTKDSMPEHINAARNALLSYIHETGNTSFVEGKMIFLQGSPLMQEKNGIKIGRLSGIVAHYVPTYLQRNRLPSFQTNCMGDWESKVDKIVEETLHEDMRLISGIPPWVQMYFERLFARTNGKRIKDIFRNFSLFVYGGVNFEPYRSRLEEIVGKRIDSIETYPASEGFIAFQDSQKEKGMLLLPDSGIFYEFVPAEEVFHEQPTRLSLSEVELNRNYALILSTNAGLWAYNLGDTVKFVSLNPYRIVVSGRIKHFISAFGEHVIGEEVEHALMSVARSEGVEVTEFTVAPQVNPPVGELPYHEWFIEFGTLPVNLNEFRAKVDQELQRKNSYYFDLIEGKILQPLIIRSMKKGSFINYMRSLGKLGGQNKLPRLANDRIIADQLENYIK
ncbi:GH3 auxin-responsive promoter family protein [Olivibacter sp. SDN3]|uniref:GH3 auxin-responsive promoter family protein n=1 Tax=Olivibacter sp. SDN3 TaxID=2764720 RepID=UPI001650F5DC|nr:GH3 auxin-responsive promoter family protein [Olivibacter sp. SDN3]QNL49180.1 GH3 auxin-responsive promoter family protein [Olivibacter sp. SDN3]